MEQIARKTTKLERRQYKLEQCELEREERLAEDKDQKYIRKLARGTGRSYFRDRDGRLLYITKNGGVGTELGDPETSRALLAAMKKHHDAWDLKNGRIVAKKKTARQIKEEEQKMAEEYQWHKAHDQVPTNTGRYRCIIEKGIFKKKVEEKTISYTSRAFGSFWMKDKGERVVYWKKVDKDVN